MSAQVPRRTWLQRLRRVVRTAFHRTSGRDLDDEIGAYVDALTSKYRQTGLSPEDARRAAMVEVGGVEQVKEATRAVHPWYQGEMLWRDVRHAVRSLRRAPAFTATILLTVTVGVATATAIFTVAHQVLLRPLPYPEPDRIVAMEPGAVRVASYSNGSIAAEALALPEFTALGFYVPAGLNLSEDGAALRLTAAAATSGFFDVLGVPVLHGRPFTVADDNAGRVAILGFGLWSRAFNQDPTVIGRSVRLNDQSFEIVGVMPAGFGFPAGVDVWVPPYSDRQMAGQAIVPRVIGRLAPGTSVSQAAQALDSLRPASEKISGEARGQMSTLQAQLTRGARPTLLLLTSTVALLLAATVVNVSGLVLLWLRNREREFLVRLALGAGRGRVFRQVLVEMALLAIVGGVGGIVAAAVGIRTFASVNASSIAGELSGATDWRVAALGSLTVLVLMCVVSLAVALSVSRTTPASIVRGTASRSRRATATNSTLVVAQIACAVVILVAASSAALLTNRLARVELGYDNTRAIVFEVTLPRVRYADRFAIDAFAGELIARLEALPGVTSVGATNLAPGGQGLLLGTTLALTGADGASTPGESDGEEGGHRDTAIAMSATPGYLRGLGVPLIAGRYFDQRDTRDGPPVVILTAAAARALGSDPNALIGRRLLASQVLGIGAPEIVGVVGDIRPSGVGSSEAAPYVYALFGQSPPLAHIDFVVSSTDSSAGMIASIRRTVNEIDPGLPLYNVRNLQDVRQAFLRTERVTVGLTGTFSVVALILSGIGLFGVMAQDVAVRRREIGIRLALGARASTLRWSFLGWALALSAVGIACGAVLATLGWQAADALVAQIDTPSMGMVLVDVIVVLLASGVAAWVPASRAARVDPALTLRSES